MLKPVVAKEKEDWPTLDQDLDVLNDQMKVNRTLGGLTLQEIPPVSHSTDLYGRHRSKLNRFYIRKYAGSIPSVRACAPKADATGVSLSSRSMSPTTITGEPAHKSFELQRLVAFAANDREILVLDQKDTLARLSAELCPVDASSYDLESLLLESVQLSRSDANKSKVRQPQASSAMKAFLEQPRVDVSMTWKKLFRASPPRETIARLARLHGATPHQTVQFYNYASARAYKREIRRVVRWYRPGRRLTRTRRGVVRDGQNPAVMRGVRTAITKKLMPHFKRLRKPLAVEGMMQWRTVALATRGANIPIQSDTVPVERLWAGLDAMLPREGRKVSLRWFNVISQLMFLRVNLRHYASRNLPGVTEQDPLLAQLLTFSDPSTTVKP